MCATFVVVGPLRKHNGSICLYAENAAVCAGENRSTQRATGGKGWQSKERVQGAHTRLESHAAATAKQEVKPNTTTEVVPEKASGEREVRV
jgi:hypothetical protein